MCSHLRRHKPDSYLVAEQDTLLFFYCFQTARVCVLGGGWMGRGRFKRRRRRRKEREEEKKTTTADAPWLSRKMQQLCARWAIIHLQCITMLLTNQWLWQWWLCVTANIKHSDSLPACYGDCSKGALGARVLIARRGVCECVFVSVCDRVSCIEHICVFCACVQVWVWKFNADAQEMLMKASCHWLHLMNHTYC